MVTQPHEPEIEALARAARGFLWCARRVFVLAGVVAIVWGLECVLAGRWVFFTPYSLVTPAMGFTFCCVGIPLVLPIDWTFGRGRWPLAVASAGLWFAPCAMQDDPQYGWILRIFATLIACASLLVWRTLWRLTRA